MGRFGVKKCALLQCVFWRSRLTHSHHLLGKRVRRRYYRFVNRDMERGDRQAGGVVMGQGEMSQKNLAWSRHWRRRLAFEASPSLASTASIDIGNGAISTDCFE